MSKESNGSVYKKSMGEVKQLLDQYIAAHDLSEVAPPIVTESSPGVRVKRALDRLKKLS